MLVNAMRAHMAEFGIIAPQGLRHVENSDDDNCCIKRSGCPNWRSRSCRLIVDQLNGMMARVREIEARLAKWHRQESG